MTKTTIAVNSQGFATLTNVALALQLMDQLVNREPNLPGLGVMSGPSGYGKSSAMAVTANKHRAIYVECRSYFTKKSSLQAILDEMAVKAGRTIYEMVAQVCEELMLSRKPLIVDEVDHLVDRNLVELLRDIYEGSGAAILMVGEELFPRKIKRWERFDNRILAWVLAEPCNKDDARKLAKLYAPDVDIDDAWLTQVLKVTRHVTRRVSVNIDLGRKEAKKLGKRTINLDWWGDRPFYTGEAPVRRTS